MVEEIVTRKGSGRLTLCSRLRAAKGMTVQNCCKTHTTRKGRTGAGRRRPVAVAQRCARPPAVALTRTGSPRTTGARVPPRGPSSGSAMRMTAMPN